MLVCLVIKVFYCLFNFFIIITCLLDNSSESELGNELYEDFDEDIIVECDEFLLSFLVLFFLLRCLVFFSMFMYAFQLYIIRFFIYWSNLEKSFFLKYFSSFDIYFYLNQSKVQFKIFISNCLQIYKNSLTFVFYLNLLDWCYQKYPIKTFLFFFYCFSCVTFEYMHYFEVGFHFYEFFESLLYFVVNFCICLILLFYLFIFLLNLYGLYLQFRKLDKLYHYLLFFSLLYLILACPFYYCFDLFFIPIKDNAFF